MKQAFSARVKRVKRDAGIYTQYFDQFGNEDAILQGSSHVVN